jgi:phosphate acetyltransferase
MLQPPAASGAQLSHYNPAGFLAGAAPLAVKNRPCADAQAGAAVWEGAAAVNRYNKRLRMSLPEPARAFVASKIARLREVRPLRRIVFPEGGDDRIRNAAERLAGEGILQPVLLGGEGPGRIDPATSGAARKYAAILREKRRAKGMTQLEAEAAARQPLYFANLMVAAGDADGCVASAVYTTAETVRAAIHCHEMEPGVRRVSSAHIMAVQDRSFGHQGMFAFSDAAINVDPSASELAEIAMSTARTTRRLLETEPLVALLSFSTKGSARHKLADKVVDALRYVEQRAPDLAIDGELQADAALVPSIGQSKSPGSRVAGRANTLIFPDLNSANIGYKLVERLGGGALLAVLLQGIAKPSNIVSRGCSAEDVYHTAILTALQAVEVRSAAYSR